LGSRPAELPDCVRFGDDFELDVRAYRLRSAGIPLKLKPTQMELLLLLIERRGELVTREQIVERIWGQGVFLDTDNSINTAVSRIRQVLRDNTEQPRFVETVTGRGYRFIATVVEGREAFAAAQPVDAQSANSAGELGETPKKSITLNQAINQATPPPETSSRWRLYAVALGLLLLVSASLTFWWFHSKGQRAASNGRVMVAVLPFENLTGDASQEYFSDGLTEEMIAQLGRLDPQHLGLIARTSVMHYKGSPAPLEQIGRELGVQYVLEGSVRRDSGKVRISAQLIQMKDQTHLWARQYDRELSNLLVLQSEIAQEIADEIQTSLGGRKPVKASSASPALIESDEAYDLYLKGQYFWNKRTIDGFQHAIDYYQQAIAKDPNSARAYAGLADTYALLGPIAPPQNEFMPKARAAAVRALQIDDNLAEAHTALALIVQNYDWDWQTSEKEFRRAIELNPNYATAHHWYAEHLAWQGRFEEALRESERARQLDPLSLIIATDNGAILYYSRQYDRAIAQFGAVREMDPEFWRAGLVVFAYAQKGMFTEALKEVETKKPKGPYEYGTLAYVYGRSGQMSQARLALETLEDLNRHQALNPAPFIRAYIGIGDKDQAFASLEKAYSQRGNIMVTLRVDPLYDPLRRDPRFQALLDRVAWSQ
jgi:TolB-like protein/DNA-binding winged helix-turn-helix (wHTH) protein/Tfp pilus assembly protein PilF